MSPFAERPSERLTVLFLAGLLGVALVARPPGWGPCALGLAALLGLAATVFRDRKNANWALLRDFLPVGMVLGCFLLLQPLVAGVNSRRWDGVLAAADARWFGGLPAAWRGAFGRPTALTDGLYAAYLSFYLLPITVAVLLRWRRGPASFERGVFVLLLGFYLSYLGYFLWPAEGPRVPQALEATRLGGGAFSEASRMFLRATERTTLDAFPSGHTAISLLAAWLASRSLPRLSPLLWLWALAIVFATVYLSAHYLVDVVAGGLLGILVCLVEPPLARLLGSGWWSRLDSNQRPRA